MAMVLWQEVLRIADEDEISGKATYKVDDGNIVFHNPNDGSVVLAKKLLDCIKEVK